MHKNSKDKKIKNKFNSVTKMLLLLSSILLICLSIYANLFPTMYLLVLTITLIVINVFLMFKITSDKTRKKIKKLFQIITIFLSVILLTASFFIGKTRFLLNSSNVDYKTHNFSVIVLNSSKYLNINNLENMSMGYYNNSSK